MKAQAKRRSQTPDPWEREGGQGKRKPSSPGTPMGSPAGVEGGCKDWE